MAYKYQPYPKMLHKPDGSYKVVQNEEEKDAALANGWNEKPGPVREPKPEPAEPPESEPEPPETPELESESEEQEPPRRPRGRPPKAR